MNEGLLAGVGGGMVLAGLPVYYACVVPFLRHGRRDDQPSMMFSAEEADRLVEGYHAELKSELEIPWPPNEPAAQNQRWRVFLLAARPHGARPPGWPLRPRAETPACVRPLA